MHVFGPVNYAAPLATGHPSGLPSIKRPYKTTTKVQALAETFKTEDVQPRKASPDSYGDELDPDSLPEEHVAPPSVLQLKILQLLEDQLEHDRQAEESDQATAPQAPGLYQSPELVQTAPPQQPKTIAPPHKVPDS